MWNCNASWAFADVCLKKINRMQFILEWQFSVADFAVIREFWMFCTKAHFLHCSCRSSMIIASKVTCVSCDHENIACSYECVCVSNLSVPYYAPLWLAIFLLWIFKRWSHFTLQFNELLIKAEYLGLRHLHLGHRHTRTQSFQKRGREERDRNKVCCISFCFIFS